MSDRTCSGQMARRALKLQQQESKAQTRKTVPFESSPWRHLPLHHPPHHHHRPPQQRDEGTGDENDGGKGFVFDVNLRVEPLEPDIESAGGKSSGEGAVDSVELNLLARPRNYLSSGKPEPTGRVKCSPNGSGLSQISSSLIR